MQNINRIVEQITAAQERKPGNYTPAQLKNWFKKLPEDQQQELLEKFDIFWRDAPEKTILHKILELCRKIVHYDLGFENKVSEIERAKSAAEKIKVDYDELVKLVEQVEPKDVHIVKEMLKMLEHPWMRVLGDQLKYKDNLEDKLKHLTDHIAIKQKEKEFKLEKVFNEIKIPKDEPIDVTKF